MPPKASTSASKANNSAKSTSSGATAGVKKSGSTGASSAGTSKNASKSVVRNGSSNFSNGYGDANEDDEREPVASTSSNRASSQQAPLQMTQLEVILHNAALASSKRVCTWFSMSFSASFSYYRFTTCLTKLAFAPLPPSTLHY